MTCTDPARRQWQIFDDRRVLHSDRLALGVASGIIVTLQPAGVLRRFAAAHG